MVTQWENALRETTVHTFAFEFFFLFISFVDKALVVLFTFTFIFTFGALVSASFAIELTVPA
jgi:hypothetical protein